MSDKVYKTTKQDFEKYKKETIYWIDKFGLKDFEIYVEHDQMDEDARALAISNLEAKMARSILQQLWSSVPANSEIEKVAFHEVMEILLSPLWILSERRFVTQDEIEQARHAIIRRFENCVWKPDFEKRKK